MRLPTLSLAFVATIVSSALLPSCSDPVPPPAQGTAWYSLSRGAGQDQCLIAGGVAGNLPTVTGKAQAVTTTDAPARVVNGDNGSVSCRVSPSGSAFSVLGTIQVSSPHTELLHVNGTFAPGQSDAKGSVTIADANIPSGASFASTNCVFSVKPANSIEGLDIAAGRVWGSFTCSDIADDSKHVCSAQGIFVFENCDQ